MPWTASAQSDDDGTRLSRLIEDQLSDGAARQVSIQGFRGALSSEATLERMTISDADGAWLVLENATLIWTRTALLTGALRVDALTAERLEIIRPPLPEEGVELADAETQPFSLPELPVSVEIGTFEIDELVLGEALMGLPATLSIAGNATLADGSGDVAIDLNRLDGPRGAFTIAAGFVNETRMLDLSVLLDEDEGGLAVELLNLPDRPDLRLSLEGSGPLSEFTATLDLSTQGEERLAGQVISSRDDAGVQTIVANIGGDIRPLLVPEYRSFFGEDTRLQARVAQTPDGATELEQLNLNSAALSLEGDLTINAQGLPDIVRLNGEITPPNGDSVRLPSGGTNVEIRSAVFDLAYDRADGQQYNLNADLDGLTVDDLAIQRTALGLSGIVALTDAGLEAATAELAAGVIGLSHSDPGLAQAMGTDLSLAANVSWVDGAPVLLSDLLVTAGDVSASGSASVQSGEDQLNSVLDLQVDARDLSRFAQVAGQPLAGSVALAIDGTAEVLSGAFDMDVSGLARNLVVADAVPVELFAGQTDLSLTATRNENGLNIRDLSLENAELSLTGDAGVSSGDTSLDANFTLREVGLFTDMISGPATIDAQIARTGTAPFDVALSLDAADTVAAQITGTFDAETQGFDIDATADVVDIGAFNDILSGPASVEASLARAGEAPIDIDVALTGPNEISADISGAFDPETQDFDLAVEAGATDLDIGNGVPAGLLAGRTSITVAAQQVAGVITVDNFLVQNPALRAEGAAVVGPDNSDITLDARLANVGIFTTALSGPVTADARVTRAGQDPWRVDADLTGPGGINVALAGDVGLPDGSVNLTARGGAPLALANQFIAPRSIQGTLQFNLALQGQPGLDALSGTFSAQGARVAAPSVSVSLQDLGITGQIASGRVSFNGSGGLSTGGQLTTNGSINVASAGLDGQISLGLQNARFIDPTLYNALVSRADITVSGPLARGPQVSGTITLGETELRVPEASLAGSAAIPDIRHIGESRDARLTRQFAGLLGSTSSSGGGGSAATGLDITINAPGRIFLRGRGLDAEFGGSIRLFGTTANVIPTGRFALTRGRLSILGTRLDITEGEATLQGSFDPFLRIAATSRASGYQITISMVGPASDPEITFSSDPALPEDEVLAQLLFGRSVSALSPLQLLQMADAAASLAGGSSNAGFIAGLRDGLGLDDLDLGTDDEGNAAVTAGRYLSDNIYTDVTINAEGDADLSLNIDLTPSITARGSVGSDGGSSIGIFFEQDY